MDLTTQQRNSLSDGAFALPEKRKYPVHDLAHARNALARVAQHGTPAEKKQVQDAVHARFPDIGKEASAEVDKHAGIGSFLTRKLMESEAPSAYVAQVSAASGIPEDQVRPYVRNIRPHRFMVDAKQFAKDLHPVWEVKEKKYNPLQQQLMRHAEGSAEEKAFLQQHSAELDRHYMNWMHGQAAMRAAYCGGDSVGSWGPLQRALEQQHGPDWHHKSVIGHMPHAYSERQKEASAGTIALTSLGGSTLGGIGAYLKERERQHVGRMGMDDLVQRGLMKKEDADRSKELGNQLARHRALVGAAKGGVLGLGAGAAAHYAPAALGHLDDFIKTRARMVGDEYANATVKALAPHIAPLSREVGKNMADAAVAAVAPHVTPLAQEAGHAAVAGGMSAAKSEVGAARDRVLSPFRRAAGHIRDFIVKESSVNLSTKIAGTVRASDFAVFEEMYKDAAVADLLPICPSTMAALNKIASKGVGTRMTVQGATKLASRGRFDVVQVRPTEFGYLVKWAAAPDGVQPQQQEMSQAQAQQTLPPEALQTADQQGVATMTGVEAEPDPLEEQVQPVEGFGTYKVHEASTGNELVGYVIPTLFDPRTGQTTPTKLFTNGSAFALQPDIAGVLVGVSYNLPGGQSEPRGLGVFYKTDGKGIIATIPFTVMTAVSVEGVRYYAAQTMEGMEVQITPSDGIRRPIATSPTEIAMPADYVWMPLNGQVELMGAGADPMMPAKIASFSSSAVIRAWTDGYGGLQGAKLTGPVFEKVGSGDYGVPDAIFYLAAAGVPQNLSVALMEKAAMTGEPVRIYGLRTLSPDPAIVKEAFADAVADIATTRGPVPKPVCLLKEAMAIELYKEAKALAGVDSLDTLLSLGFINAENVQDFVNAIPELEETQSKLASLVFATQLGLQSIPKTAAVRAMTSLEEVITGLKGLKTYKL